MKFQPQLKLTLHKQMLEYLNGSKINPINIEISPCGMCNATCPWCFYGAHQSGKLLDSNLLIKFINDAICNGVKAITWTGGGEPTLHPNFKTFIKELNIQQGLITNGLKIPDYDPTTFSWIRVSKTNKDWNKQSLKILRDCKSVGLCINYVGNEREIEETLELVYELNIDYLQVRPALNINGEHTSINVPSITDKKLILTEYKFKESNNERIYSKCEGYHFVPFLWEDGNLDVCAYKKNNLLYNIGNINNLSYADLLLKFPKFVNVTNDCQICCKNHEINSLIHKLKTIEDVNFV